MFTFSTWVICRVNYLFNIPFGTWVDCLTTKWSKELDACCKFHPFPFQICGRVVIKTKLIFFSTSCSSLLFFLCNYTMLNTTCLVVRDTTNYHALPHQNAVKIHNDNPIWLKQSHKTYNSFHLKCLTKIQGSLLPP